MVVSSLGSGGNFAVLLVHAAGCGCEGRSQLPLLLRSPLLQIHLALHTTAPSSGGLGHAAQAPRDTGSGSED